MYEQHAVHRRAATQHVNRGHRWRATRPPTRATPDEVPRRAGGRQHGHGRNANPQRQRKRQGTGEIEWHHVAVLFQTDIARVVVRPG